MTVKQKSKREIKDGIRYGKIQICNSEKFLKHRDLLQAVLEPDQTYTTAEIEKIIAGFKKGKVK